MLIAAIKGKPAFGENTLATDTAVLIQIVLRSRPHPEQGFRYCIGILGIRKWCPR